MPSKPAPGGSGASGGSGAPGDDKPVPSASDQREPGQREPGWVDPRPDRWRRFASGFDLALRVVGGALSVVAAVLTAGLELIFATLRVGGYLIGVSVLIAVIANVALSWFALRTVGSAWAVTLPAVTWFAVMVVAAGGTTEGDIVLTGGNWVGLAMIVAGAMAFAVMAFRMVLAPRPAPPARRG